LRTITTVFDTFRPYIKLQQELFLFFLIERLSPASGTGSRGVSVDVDQEGNISFVASSHHGVLDNSTGDRSSPSPATNSSSTSQVEIRSGSPSMFLGRSNDYYQSKSHRSTHSISDHYMIPGEIREMLLECLLQCARIPTFMVDLWFNYDCDLSCGDLFEEMIQFLSKVMHDVCKGWDGII
jgi:brefeldin A-resistance guanine nucleotide exchange factor 1